MKRHLNTSKSNHCQNIILFIILFRCCYDLLKNMYQLWPNGRIIFFSLNVKTSNKACDRTRWHQRVCRYFIPWLSTVSIFFYLLKFTEMLFELLDMLRDSQLNLLIFIINHFDSIKCCSLLFMSCFVHFFVKMYHTPLIWRDVLVHLHV